MGAVAWPIAAIIIVLVFRDQLISLAARVKELSAPGINATFENELEKTREIAESAATPAVDDAARGTSTIDVSTADLAKVYPEAAVLQSYHEIEKLLRKLNPEKGTPHSAFLSALSRCQIIRREDQELFNQIRRTRNAAVHSERPITTGEALEFQALVNVFLEAIKSVRSEIDSQKDVISDILFKPRLLRA